MRRFFLLFTLLLLIFGAIATAQQDELTLKYVPPSDPIPIPDEVAIWEPMVKGLYVPVELEPQPFVRGTRAANDTCPGPGNNNLPAFNVSSDQTIYFAGDLTIVNGYTVESSDPLACSDVLPANQRGYRTAWYRFIAPATGKLTVTTLPNFSHEEDYDTIITVLEGNVCASAAVVACNDDANGFLSQVDLNVTQGQTYLIEIADYNLEVSGEAKVNVSVRIDSADFSTTNAAWNQLPAIRSRHVSKVIDDKIYIFGGQTVVDEDAPIRTGATDVFDPADGTWEPKSGMIGVCAEGGYSNTSASYYVQEDFITGEIVARQVFFPSGYVGDAEIHSGVNCVYDVDTDLWSIGTSAPFIDGDAPIHTSVLNFSTGFVVIGGLKDAFFDPKDGNPSSDVYTYFVDNDLWQVNEPYPPLPQGRYAHTGATLFGRFFCITGGLSNGVNGDGEPTNVFLNDSLCLSLNEPANGWQPIAGLNIPRFNASSAIGEDGSWIVYGGVGVNANGLYSVPEIEIYDLELGQWVVLDDRYDLTNPARTWAEGGIVNGSLWAIGGEYDIANNTFGNRITPEVVEINNIPLLNTFSGNDIFFPFMAQNKVFRRNLQTQAIPIGIGQLVENNFNETGDRFDVYAFTVPALEEYKITLTNIPSGDNYNLFLYSNTKTEINFSKNIGNLDELIVGGLDSGLYYLLVAVEEDTTPQITGNYRLLVERR